MGPAQIANYAGTAALYAAGLVIVLAGLARLAGRPPGGAMLAFMFSALFVIFLGIHPFPDPARLDCTAGGAGLILPPFEFTKGYVRWWRAGHSLETALRSLSILSPVMNLILFMPAGLALAAMTGRWRVALAVGLGLTLFIEIAQLSALFGIYPCRYRRFETGDIILNTSGVVLGFALMRAWAWRRRPA